jgi:hypothetical protein
LEAVFVTAEFRVFAARNPSPQKPETSFMIPVNVLEAQSHHPVFLTGLTHEMSRW